MKNYFLNLEKEKGKSFDQEINLTANLKSTNGHSNNMNHKPTEVSMNNPTVNSNKNYANINTNSILIKAEVIKNFLNKTIYETLDEVYLINYNKENSSIKIIDPNQKKNNSTINKLNISDLNVKFFVGKNFLREKTFINKFFLHLERLSDMRQDTKINKMIRILKNEFFSSFKYNIAIVAKESDFSIIENNIKCFDRNYTKISKSIFFMFII